MGISFDNSDGVTLLGGGGGLAGKSSGSTTANKGKVNKFVSGMQGQISATAKYIGTRTNKPELIKMAAQNTKTNLINKAISDIQRGNQRLTTKTKIRSTVRREKRPMTSADISRNAGIQSARLERQGQTRLF